MPGGSHARSASHSFAGTEQPSVSRGWALLWVCLEPRCEARAAGRAASPCPWHTEPLSTCWAPAPCVAEAGWTPCGIAPLPPVPLFSWQSRPLVTRQLVLVLKPQTCVLADKPRYSFHVGTVSSNSLVQHEGDACPSCSRRTWPCSPRCRVLTRDAREETALLLAIRTHGPGLGSVAITGSTPTAPRTQLPLWFSSL